MNWLWWLLAGILIGWLLSTLIEWLWFRRKRMEVRDARVAELEGALRASASDGVAAESEAGAAAGATLFAGASSLQVDAPDVELSAPDLDAAVSVPDVDLPDVDNVSTGVEATALGVGASINVAQGDDDGDVAASPVTAGDAVEISDSVSEADADMIANTDHPDDLTNIKGIGRVYETSLNQAGIFTYAQLAATSPEDLAAVMPNSRGDFADWIAQAAKLA